ncbi:MAG TPA: hypothetical protein DC049_11325 [Spirochaetia bacterium]|nr:hypothetical protein [Spirochaetia bacterium]
MKLLTSKFQALSRFCRFRIMHLLLKTPYPLCICELMDIMNKPQYKISRCLGALKNAGLIIEKREGRLLLHSPHTQNILNIPIFQYIKKSASLSPELAQDLVNLKKRLALRKKGKITVTYRK